LKIIEVITDAGHLDTVKGLAAQYELVDFWHSATDEAGRCSMHMLVQPENRQRLMDSLQGILSASEDSRILMYTPEVIWPMPIKEPQDEKPASSTSATREELYKELEKSAHINGNFILMDILSTIVVAIGLIEDNVAVVIGAMVIAPLLGPNLALALGAALGDRKLMGRALGTNLAGVSIAFVLCWLLGMVWTGSLDSAELLARTNVGLDGVLLALASGLAAALSLTTGLSSVLVGVMVAVALLPPTATAGIMLGAGNYELATGALLLLAVNVVCVNLSAKLVFLYKGVRPRTWIEKKQARQSYVLFMMVWIVTLSVLIAVIYLKLKTSP
jgi:uncharacterized hydrophobic protein (TIGR00341 family)